MASAPQSPAAESLTLKAMEAEVGVGFSMMVGVWAIGLFEATASTGDRPAPASSLSANF